MKVFVASCGGMGGYELKHVKFNTMESALQACGGLETFKRHLKDLTEQKLCGCQAECGDFDVNAALSFHFGRIYQYMPIKRYAMG